MIEELIYVHKVDALCVDPCVPGTLGAIIAEAAELGIPTVSGAGHKRLVKSVSSVATTTSAHGLPVCMRESGCKSTLWGEPL